MSAVAALPPPLFPGRLRPGDLVALAAPGGAVDADRVEGAVRLLEARGLRVRVRDDIAARHRYLAGPDPRRAEELRDALTHPEVKAVLLARGGYGSQRLLSALDAGALGAPRAVVGFSDNTALLNHLRQEAGWAVLHGPHPRADAPDELDAVLGCLGFYGDPARTGARGLKLWNPGPWERRLGELAGGCISLLSCAAGTPGAFRAQGRIVFLEDVGEPAYRLDRMLHHLVRAGALEGAGAVVLGRPESFLPAGEDPAHLEGLLDEFARALPFPVFSGLACGHTRPNLPLPFGPRALLDPDTRSLTFLEDLVR